MDGVRSVSIDNGAAASGPRPTELIATATTAICAELTAHEPGETIFAQPTFSEAWMEAAHAPRGESTHAAPLRRQWSSPPGPACRYVRRNR
jgi:hypothetical protein